MIYFDHNKDFDMVKLGCTQPSSAIVWFHKSTDSKFYPFTKKAKDLLEKFREDVIGGQSVVFIRYDVAGQTFIPKSTDLSQCKVGTDASQLYPYSRCQPIPTGLYTRKEYTSETEKFTAQQNKSRSFENIGFFCFHRSWQNFRVESNVTTGRQMKIECFSVDRVCNHCNTVFEAMGCYRLYCLCQEALLSLIDLEIKKRVKRRQQNEMRRDYKQQRWYQIV